MLIANLLYWYSFIGLSHLILKVSKINSGRNNLQTLELLFEILIQH